MNLISQVVHRPVATWMIAIAIAVFGFVSYDRLPLALMPDLSYPSITVRTDVPGYAPEEVESQISRPIEEALATTQGLVQLESRSKAGSSDVVMEFRWGSDMNQASQDIRERLQTTFLPDDATRPLILRYNPSLEPILRIALATTDEPDDPVAALFMLREIAQREIKRDLEAMDGVAAVSVRGGLEREVLVEVREDWLVARSIRIDQVISTLASENVNIPGGAIREGEHEYLVRTLNEVRSISEIEQLEIPRGDGVRVPISEVATVRHVHRDRTVVSHLNGTESVEIEVYKSADANVVEVANTINDRIIGDDGITANLPEGVTLTILENQAGFIEAALSNLRSTAILGAGLAVFVLFLFLRNFQATAIIAAAIPLSIVCTFAPMYLGSVSLNLMSLGGLALGIGMLVDNAVVVLENIQVHIDRGSPRRQAAIDGTKEVAAAVVASTFTTVSVFLPIAFVDGIAGQIFSDLSMAVVFSLLASLVVALFFVPMLAASGFSLPTHRTPLMAVSTASRFHSIRMLRTSWRKATVRQRIIGLPWWTIRTLLRLSLEVIATVIIVPAAIVGRTGIRVGRGIINPVSSACMWAANRFHAIYGKLASLYGQTIPTILKRPGQVLTFTACMVMAAILMGGQLSQALIPDVHQGRFNADVALPIGTPLPQTVRVISNLEETISDHPQVAHIHSVIGSQQGADSRSDEGEHTARLMIELTSGGNLANRERAVMTELRNRMGSQIDPSREISLNLHRPSLFSFRTPIEVVLYGQDLDQLKHHADNMVTQLSMFDGLKDVRSSLVAGYPEIRIIYDRDLLRRVNLTTAQVAQQIKDKIQGNRATAMSRGDQRVDLIVRLAERQRRSIEQLKRLNINPAITPPIPLESVAQFIETEGPSEIRRVDQQRAAVITANITEFDLSGMAVEIQRTLKRLATHGISWEIAGQNAEMERSSRSLKLALGLAIFLVYVIMASTFENIIHPFVILFSVPLALVGVVGALWFSNLPITIVVLIGSIVLAGVVVNNAIVLVDTINRHKATGASADDAIVTAARLRLRPILITTMTTVLGLTPLALGVGEGSEIQIPLAVTIIAGLTSSTVLTLVVIPVVYRLVTRAIYPNQVDPTPESPPR